MEAAYKRRSGRSYYICNCSSCHKTFFAVADNPGRTSAVWPLATPEVAGSLPTDVAEALAHAYRAASAEGWIACLLACKTTIKLGSGLFWWGWF